MDINKFAPTGKLNKTHLISLERYTKEEIMEILHFANSIAKVLAVGEKPTTLRNKKVALITKNGFTRPRIAFETAVSALSGTAIVCQMSGSELETFVTDKFSVAAMVGYGINALVIQTSEPNDAEYLEKLVNLPVINANGKSGPCEALSALLTVWRKKGGIGNMKIAMIGDANGFKDSFVYAFAICGFDITFVCPENLRPSETLLNYCRQFGDVAVETNLERGIKDADVIYVCDEGIDGEFKLSLQKMGNCPNAIILHTLPVMKDGVIDEELLSSANFCGLDEALALPEIEMAVLSLLIK